MKLFYNLEYFLSGKFIFNLAISILQKWLKKNNIRDHVFVISLEGWSFDDDSRYKEIMQR